jgi:hypothetical protein
MLFGVESWDGLSWRPGRQSRKWLGRRKSIGWKSRNIILAAYSTDEFDSNVLEEGKAKCFS